MTEKICFKWEQKPKKIFQNTIIILLVLYIPTFFFLYQSDATDIKVVVNNSNADFVDIEGEIDVLLGDNILHADKNNASFVPYSVITLIGAEPVNDMFQTEAAVSQFFSNRFESQSLLQSLLTMMLGGKMGFGLNFQKIVTGKDTVLTFESSTAYRVTIILIVEIVFTDAVKLSIGMENMSVNPSIRFVFSPSHQFGKFVEPNSIETNFGLKKLSNFNVIIDKISIDQTWKPYFTQYLINENDTVPCYPYIANGEWSQPFALW